MKHDEWQEEILNYKGKSIVLCTGRRVGKTTTFAEKAAKRMVTEPGTEIVAVSATEDQAFIMRALVMDYLEKNFKSYLKVSKKDKATMNKIKLNNKSSYIVRPVGVDGKSIRGFNANVLIVDEAAHIPEKAWAAARPTLLTTGGEMWLCSTPLGKDGFFYECFENKNERFKVFHISSEEVIYNRPISESWTEKNRAEAIVYLEHEKNSMSEIEYGQEYLGLFLEDLKKYFREEVIYNRCILKAPTNKMPESKYYLGVDIARMGGDACSYQIVQDLNGKFNHVFSESIRKQLTTETEIKIVNLCTSWRCKKVGIDAGAGTLGVSVLDHLLQTPIKHKVLALNNRAISLDADGKRKQRLLKEDMYENLRSMLEHGELDLLDDPEVRRSLFSVQYQFVKNAMGQTKIRITSARHEDSDLVEALARAAWLAKKEKTLNLWAA